MFLNDQDIAYYVKILRKLADDIEGRQSEVLQFEQRAPLVQSPDYQQGCLNYKTAGLRIYEVMIKDLSLEKQLGERRISAADSGG
jgi:hypothetical protein